MTELSFLARLILTLLILALSLFAYKWLRVQSVPPPQSFIKQTKKRSKKKTAKKSASPSPSQVSLEKPEAYEASSNLTVVAPATAIDNDNGSESDSDDGLSAAQVLATRKFKPKNLGGRIKTSLSSTNVFKFAVGQKVFARFKGKEEWFRATVLEQRKGNEYHLKYDDGEVEYRVPAEFIKLQSTKNDEKAESSNNNAAVSESKMKAEEASVHEASSSSDLSESDDDDGWQVVGTSSAAKRQRRNLSAAALAEPLVDGLTKRQRENRRKKERQREKKVLLRQHAQKDDLNARARWRYVPS